MEFELRGSSGFLHHTTGSQILSSIWFKYGSTPLYTTAQGLACNSEGLASPAGSSGFHYKKKKKKDHVFYITCKFASN